MGKFGEGGGHRMGEGRNRRRLCELRGGDQGYRLFGEGQSSRVVVVAYRRVYVLVNELTSRRLKSAVHGVTNPD